MTMRPTHTFIIIEDGEIMDGEAYNREGLLRAIQYASYDARIMQLDLAEFMRDGATNARDVTADLVSDWWHANGLADTYERIAAGDRAPGLAYRYFSDECAAYEMRVAS